ncbi:MAG: NADH-quinone oxidoreductase subunit E [Tabrizicola sp.]|uniref:NADH-quinone oxidoreductase subunit E n=1 Tax=Tabrizicola sp. TaxID=2005166 RepID=UPI0027371C93|nr:NADH-quinone oxidoreductase subunit E [Tabrizicola sp.]MDP3262802.1 NADH-quinone oxidoreductase subunit E [Tabrizicola sp.]MDP3648998.1 NADH-quinone oxidoreductase subunit E [Paracoccaceae bacterium]MDZ4068728.1 NADH-quinone oxidoreductase subunit E [Tabrizicola sp.]
MLRRLHKDQPASFEFTPANTAWARGQISKYPEGRQASAIIPLLWRAQEQEGWLSRPAIEHVASMLGLAYIRALEVATFYFMFQLQPVGSVAHIQICGTTSCMICGAEDLVAVCKELIARQPHALSADGRFSWEEVECLGACANAPMAQIGKDYYEDLTPEKLRELIGRFSGGEVPVPGSQIGRYAAEPASGLTSLTEFESGRRQYNASVQAAVDLGDTIKRIDGTEVPLTTPWLGKPAAVKPAKGVPVEPKPGRGKPVDATGTTVLEAQAQSKGKPVTDGNAPNATPLATPEAKVRPTEVATGPAKRPEALAAARGGKPDDLSLIVGIGPKLAALCNRLGFYHFDQIANWTSEEITWVDANLEGFKGRVTRDRWVPQAKILAAGGTVAEAEAAARRTE